MYDERGEQLDSLALQLREARFELFARGQHGVGVGAFDHEQMAHVRRAELLTQTCILGDEIRWCRRQRGQVVLPELAGRLPQRDEGAER